MEGRPREMTGGSEGGDAATREKAALFDFFELWHEDRAAGRKPELAHYLARFPDCQAAIAREYLRLTSVTPLAALSDAASGEAPADARYTRREEIARGGMGVVERVHDERLARDLAMKSALRSGVNARLRFEKEARLTGQLDHPGIVPVHDFGERDDGAPWFTMRLISGRDLREIIQLVHSPDDDEWGLPAALNVLLRVCETVAFAHSRGVVHRDLKPSNVRVGRFGEVYVIDWGLARAEHQPELDDLRLQVDEAAYSSVDSPLLTMDGDVIGTPCNMPPEQAAGHLDEVGPRSDVYAVGAMLYELLSGRMPYVEPGERVAARSVLERVLAGPPAPLAAIAPDAPAELAAICSKAMARDPAQRYMDMREMAADVRAYLEGRVVRAYRTGVRAELGKWVVRNRRLTVAIAAGLAVALTALVALGLIQGKNRARLRLLADSRAPADLVARAAALSTGRPEDAPGLRGWLDEASDLIARLPEYRRERARLQARALPWNADAPREQAIERNRRARVAGFGRLIAYYEGELARMQAEGGLSEEGFDADAVRARLVMLAGDRDRTANVPVERLTYEFRDHADAERLEAIERLLADIRPLLDSGSDKDDRAGLVTVSQRRLALAESIEQRTLVDAASAWARALAEIADPDICPRYEGLRLRPQLGLVPLRRNDTTGLWEFVHLASGEPPRIEADGTLRLEESTGVVFALLPSARVDLGAQATHPERANWDPDAQPDECTLGADGPELVHAILAPFFLSVYELTQAQWSRISGGNPSELTVASRPEHVRSRLHPVESVDWISAKRELGAVGLTLPSEAQWEYAARGSTSTPWWTGRTFDSLMGLVNIADEQFARLTRIDTRRAFEALDVPGFDDGAALHAPVGSYRPNGFGLFDVAGNVNEWCLDSGFIGYDKPEEVLIDTFERRLWGEGLRVRRGGSFEQRALVARSAARQFNGPEYVGRSTGVRPARNVDA